MAFETLIRHATRQDLRDIVGCDRHIAPERLCRCVQDGHVYVLQNGGNTVGVLRYSFFWQSLPFTDFLFIDDTFQKRGYGRAMMQRWETDMKCAGYRYVMTSTQADESAWQFYEKLGYRRVGGFFPPEQDAEEWMYLKSLQE